MTLPFQVRCDSFSMELYKNGMPKEYRSDITFFQDNQEAVSTSILVNHPISFKSIQFSQKGFNKIPVRFPDGSIVTGYSTILGVNKDPGLPAVIFGALIFLAGIMISFLKANPL
jgi:cytochrome c biogenesis protein ResB